MPSTGRCRGGALEDRLVEPVQRQPARGALDMTDSGDDGERRLAHLRRVDRDDRIAPRTHERGRDAAQVPGAVVGDHDPHAIAPARHASPFVDWMPEPPVAQASRSARPSALKAASATWWSSLPDAST